MLVPGTLGCIAWGRTAIYAIIETGGRQYRVVPGQTLDVERLSAIEESSLELGRVLLVSDDQQVLIGNPLVEGALVVAKVVAEHKGTKVVGMKYKPKTRYRRKLGHRQVLTRITIQDIRLPGQEPPAAPAPAPERAAAPRRRRAAAATPQE